MNARSGEIMGEYTKRQEDRSAQLMTDAFIAMQDRDPNDQVTVKDIIEATAGMTPADQLMMGKLMVATQQEKGQKSDPRTVNTPNAMLSDLGMAKDEAGAARLRGITRGALTDAIEQGRLVGSDAMKYINSLNKVETVFYDNPRLDAAEDELWLILTGTSKSAFDNGSSKASNLVNANAALQEMRESARAAGDYFDPSQWMDENIERFKTKTILRAEDKRDENIFKKYVRYDTQGNLNVLETSQLFNADIDAGRIAPEDEDRLRTGLEAYINRVNDQENQ